MLFFMRSQPVRFFSSVTRLTLYYPGVFGVAEPGGGGHHPPPLRITLILHPKLTKLGTIVDFDKFYFFLAVKVLNWLSCHNDVIFSILTYQTFTSLGLIFLFQKECSEINFNIISYK